MRLPGKALILVCTGMVLLWSAGCEGFKGESVMKVWMDSPWVGDKVMFGEDIFLQAHARDAGGPGITEIGFIANEQILATANTSTSDPIVSAVYSWKPPAPGIYDIFARAVSMTGGVVDSDTITITILDTEDTPAVSINPEPGITQTVTRIAATATVTATPYVPILTPSQTLTQHPPTLDLSVDVSSINFGNCAVLTWKTSNVNQVKLGDEIVDTSGSRTACPQQTTTYTLMGYSSSGTLSDSVTITVNFNFPTQRTSSYVNISVTGGHGSLHHIGDTLQICYSFNSTSYLFEFRDYSPASIGSDGATGPYGILASGTMFEPKNVCKNYTMVAPGGYEAFQFRVSTGGGEQAVKLIDYAEIWIYLLP